MEIQKIIGIGLGIFLSIIAGIIGAKMHTSELKSALPHYDYLRWPPVRTGNYDGKLENAAGNAIAMNFFMIFFVICIAFYLTIFLGLINKYILLFNFESLRDVWVYGICKSYIFGWFLGFFLAPFFAYIIGFIIEKLEDL